MVYPMDEHDDNTDDAQSGYGPRGIVWWGVGLVAASLLCAFMAWWTR